MPTAVGDEVVECVGTSSTLLLSSRAIFCRDWNDLSDTGPSRGRNVTIPATAGTLERDRVRGELPVTLRNILVNGRYNQDGVRQTSGTRANALALKRIMVGFFVGANLNFTIRLTEGASVYEAEAQFEEWGQWRWHAADVAEVSMLITVNDGALTLQP